MLYLKVAIGLFIGVGLCQISRADIINGGFETIPSLTGWTLNNASFGGVNSTGMPLSAHSGSRMGRITSGIATNTYTTLSQTLDLSIGDELEGWVRFFSWENTSSRDDAYVRVLSGGTSTVMWSGGNPAAPNYITAGSTPWTQWSWTAPMSGQYTLQFGVRNGVDNVHSTSLFLDDVTLTKAVTGTVPDAGATILLLGTVTIGLGIIRYRTSNS
jgi:hypothetical protein